MMFGNVCFGLSGRMLCNFCVIYAICFIGFCVSALLDGRFVAAGRN